MRGGERAERRGEDEQERGPGVAQRPARDLAPGERRHEPRPRTRSAFGELGEARDEAHREDGPGEQPDRRCRDQQRVDPQRAARGPGDRRAVQAELDERDDRQDDEREVEPQPLRQRPAHLPPDRGPDAGDRRPREQRRDRQREDREGAADERDRERAPAGQRRLEPDAFERGVEPDGLDEERRRPGCRDDRRDRHEQRLAQGHRHEVPEPAAAGPQEGGLGPPPLEEERCDEDDRVAGEHAELDEQQQDPGLGHEHRAVDGREDRGQPGEDLRLVRERERGVDPVRRCPSPAPRPWRSTRA